MRELVYLSKRKLATFHPELPAARADPPSLDDVLAYLTETPGKLRWYAEDGLRPGQWIQFEALLSWEVMDLEDARPVVFFAEPDVTATPRLVLHGSPRHLLEEPEAPQEQPTSQAVRRVPYRLADPDGDQGTAARLPRFRPRTLLRELDRSMEPRTATRLAGVARISTDASKIGAVFATPLYVEYLRQE
jgi:hypothetical protein